MKYKVRFLLGLVLPIICFSAISAAQVLKPVQLPPPQKGGIASDASAQGP